MTRSSGEPADIWMVQRPKFDNWLVERARKSGADVRIGVKIADVMLTDAGATATTSDGETFTAQTIVGADGARGIVGTKVGLRLRRRYGIARELELPFSPSESSGIWHAGLEPGACYLDYGTVRNGYAWIFPKAGFLSVGAGMLLPGKPSKDVENNVGNVLKRAIDSLLESVSLSIPSGTDAPRLWGHPIPFWTGREPLASADGRALLVGDAAGVVQPLFGEGIQYAVRSGAIAARCISERKTTEYTERIGAEFADEFDTAARVGHLFHRAPLLSYKLGVRNPAGTRLVGRLMSGEAKLVDLEDRIVEKIRRPWK